MDNLVTKISMVGSLKLALHDNVLVDFNTISTDIQEEYLKYLLGDYLYWTFVNAIDGGTPAQKWLDLRDGVNFDTEGVTLKWQGLTNMLKHFVYYQYKYDNLSYNTVGGDSKKRNINSDSINPATKMIRAYNNGRELFGVDFNGIAENQMDCKYNSTLKKTSSGLYYRNSYGNENFDKVTNMLNESARLVASAYNFIYTKNNEDSTNYPDWKFTELENMNAQNL